VDLLKSLPANIISLFQKEHLKTGNRFLSDILRPGPEASGDSAVKKDQDHLAIQITDDFNRALSGLQKHSEVIFVTGQAGTGKSTFIRYLREKLAVNTPVLAPTGVAALNVGGQTIHSFFHIPPRIMQPDEVQPLRNGRLFKELKMLIIDEISMVRADLMDLIDISLRVNTGRSEIPFGGVRLIVVGDLFQLPPVIASETEARYIQSRYATPYFLSASCISGVHPEIVELSKVFRQQDQHFLAMLSNLREGNDLAQTIERLNRECCMENSVEDDAIILTPENAAAGRINNARLAKLPAKEHAYEGVVTGKFNLDSERLPAPHHLKLKVGARVMFTKNDSMHRWVNGTLGTVTELTPGYIVVATENCTCSAGRETWESIRYEFDGEKNRIVSRVIGAYTQFPLMLAWAVTIHKSQGKTFERMHIDIGSGAFAEGQLYVAVSRCKTLKGISLVRPIKIQDVKVNPVVKEFYAGIR